MAGCQCVVECRTVFCIIDSTLYVTKHTVFISLSYSVVFWLKRKTNEIKLGVVAKDHFVANAVGEIRWDERQVHKLAQIFQHGCFEVSYLSTCKM